MPVHVFLAASYFVLLTSWASLVMRRRQSVLRMHLLLLVVYVFAFISEFVSALDWLLYNYATGYVSLEWNIATAIVVPFRHVSCWLFLLLVCLGYDIYVYSISYRRRILIVVAAVLSFIITGLYQVKMSIRNCH